VLLVDACKKAAGKSGAIESFFSGRDEATFFTKQEALAKLCLASSGSFSPDKGIVLKPRMRKIRSNIL